MVSSSIFYSSNFVFIISMISFVTTDYVAFFNLSDLDDFNVITKQKIEILEASAEYILPVERSCWECLLPSSPSKDLVKVLTNCCLTILLTGVWKQEGSKLSCRGERCLSLGPYSLSTPSYQPIQRSYTQQHSRHSHPPTLHLPHSTLIFYSSSFILTHPPDFPCSSFLHGQNMK